MKPPCLGLTADFLSPALIKNENAAQKFNDLWQQELRSYGRADGR